MINDALNQISGAYGNVPLATGAQTVELPSYAFEASEATTFGAFYNSAGAELTFHPWKGKSLAADKVAFFGQSVASFTITAGGLGTLYLSEAEMPLPALLTRTTTEDGTTIILTFDRVMANPAAYVADFTSTVNAVANVITAAALGANTKTIELTVTTVIAALEAVTVTMAYGRVTSAYGRKALNIAAAGVTNNSTV